MSTTWDETKVLSYITDKIEESNTLDYKAAGALDRDSKKTTEITKDVSAFANSNGGLIIYGMREFATPGMNHLPERIDPIERREFSKEWLEHIIAGIQPRLAVTIHPVQLSSATDHVVYVVEIPRGTTAHQARDCRYYRRYNFESVPMQDFEIRDVMRRKTNPVVATEIKIIFGKKAIDHRVFWKLTNESDILARWVCSHIQIPYFFSGRQIRFKGVTGFLDDDGYTCWPLVASNHDGGPLYPASSIQGDFPFFVSPPPSKHEGPPIKARNVVKFKTFADEMPPISGSFELSEITRQDQV